MSRLIESIKLQDGEFCNLFYHAQRMNRSCKELYGHRELFDLEAFLDNIERPLQGLYKCRIVYDHESRQVEFLPYQPTLITSLQLVVENRISYAFKFADRREIDRLHAQRKDCDDVIIVKQGLITDSSYANIAFKKGSRWYTPALPLLKGTMRTNLLERNIIYEQEIGVDEIRTFKSFKLINAMFEFDSPEIDVSNIVF
ncbi:MAG: aminotransferase class IV [Cyclobacteriaceae bacterium]|nr:aminotransferase class IV [Cyclobacteriaceae bacterium]MDH4295553.1 aminotransferase class IV [Cyclobacteriaceae bacterium]MDH5249132.1 aminotransferase class IV [Cyclobacteriaceae bacterium]